MPVTIREGIDDLAALENAFGIPRGYIDNIKNEDDWSLVIKSHALLESATANLLCHYFGKNTLLDVFASMEMSNKKSGKMAFISALELLDKEERRFISELSELRNLVVHNASNVTFRLRDYVASVTKDKRKKLTKSLNVRPMSMEVDGKVFEGEELLLAFPKWVIWSSLTKCLNSIYLKALLAIQRNRTIEQVMKKRDKREDPEFTEDITLTISSRRTR